MRNSLQSRLDLDCVADVFLLTQIRSSAKHSVPTDEIEVTENETSQGIALSAGKMGRCFEVVCAC